MRLFNHSHERKQREIAPSSAKPRTHFPLLIGARGDVSAGAIFQHPALRAPLLQPQAEACENSICRRVYVHSIEAAGRTRGAQKNLQNVSNAELHTLHIIIHTLKMGVVRLLAAALNESP
jgi:hypothetical protein